MTKQTTTTTIVALVAAIVFGFGGYSYGKKSAVPDFTTMTPEARQALLQSFRGSAGGMAGGAVRRTGGRVGSGFYGGEVLQKDAQSLTIKLMDTGSKVVFLSSSTTIAKSSVGTLDDVAVGATVTVTGKDNSDGTVTASSIQIRPAGSPPAPGMMGGGVGRSAPNAQ